METLVNYGTLSSTITISGFIANGSGANFSTTIAVSRTNSIADIYATNRNTGRKMSLIAGSIHNPYQFISTETQAHNITYTAGIITITVSVTNNTGVGITLTSQIWDIVALLYDVPY